MKAFPFKSQYRSEPWGARGEEGHWLTSPNNASLSACPMPFFRAARSTSCTYNLRVWLHSVAGSFHFGAGINSAILGKWGENRSQTPTPWAGKQRERGVERNSKPGNTFHVHKGAPSTSPGLPSNQDEETATLVTTHTGGRIRRLQHSATHAGH